MLQHVMVVGGTVAEWGALTDDEWRERIHRVGAAIGDAGASWLTLRPFERGAAPSSRHVLQSVTRLEGCTVVVDPSPEGRERLVVALRKVAENGELTERSIATALFAPADVEPDLVIVLGGRDRLPPSLVWELAYSELVYVDVAFADLRAADVERSVAAFQARHRRFGGLD